MLFYKYVFCHTDKDVMTPLPSPLSFPGIKKERWNNNKTQFKVNTNGSWQSTEVLGHPAFFSSPEYLCAPCPCDYLLASLQDQEPFSHKFLKNTRIAF